MSKRRQKKLPLDPVTAKVLRLSHEGRGIASINGKTIFIFGALPEETVTFRYTKCHRQFDEGAVVDVLSPSKERVHPICPHFGVCGGCSLQHMHHEFQITHKQSVFLSLLKNTPPQTLLPPLLGPTEGYRRKARIGVKYVTKKQKVLVGFREKNAPYIAEMNICHTLHPELGNSIEALSELFMTLETKSCIPQLEIAVGDDATAIILRHLVPLPDADQEKLIHFFEQRQWHLYLQPQGTDSIYRLHPRDGKERLKYYLKNQNLTFEFHPTQFTQINSAINQQMVDCAIELLDLKADDRVLDLFCGIGNFSLAIAQRCKTVVGVEGDASATTQAAANAALNQLSNTEFHTANLFENTAATDLWDKQTYDKVLLDPPRSGAQEILEKLSTWHPSLIVYISCNPATLARDAEILKQKGYYLDLAGIIDMFPHTQHLEAITLFRHD